MCTTRALAVVTVVAVSLVVGLASVVAAGETRTGGGLGRLIAAKLIATRSEPRAPRATDLTGQHLECIAITQREMRRLGYPGHAFVCENLTTGEVLGAVLRRSGVARCGIAGSDAGNRCFDLRICGVADRLCVH